MQPKPQSFEDFFDAATASSPYGFQSRFAEQPELPQLINIPTGLGKTATVLLGWLYRRRFHPDREVRQNTPRRLVYCLPMRVLVEQTQQRAVEWLDKLGLLAGQNVDQPSGSNKYEPQPDDERPISAWAVKHQPADAVANSHRIAVHLLMGGETATDWAQWPERDAILIGTQDMLLSRALNRGYGMSRYRWPMHFGLLNNDSLWVMDETQLMGSGLVTTAQLAAFAERLWPQSPPCSFLWMSATLGESFLKTRDRVDWQLATRPPLTLEKPDLENPQVLKRLRASKTLQIIKDRPKAAKVLDEHVPGRLSLVVLNTVPTAKAVYSELTELAKKTDERAGKTNRQQPRICLLHSRFRPGDRTQRMKVIDEFLKQVDSEKGAVSNSPGLVLVSTQVVEAGFDISSVRLWSEVAPWSSVVQRLGRLNREGTQPDAVGTFWMPKEDKTGENNKDSPNARRIGPYDKAALETSRKLLELVIDRMTGGMAYRLALDEAIDTQEGRQSLQFEPEVVIRPDDFHDLFSTEPDLAGGFTNVAQFVRDSDFNVDVQVFWRDVAANRSPERDEPRAERNELCSVPFFDVKRFLGNKGVAWEWDYETSGWERRRAADIQAGMTLLLPRSAGGYSDELGWTGHSADKATIHPTETLPNDGLDRDPASSTEQWVSLGHHLADVEAELHELLDSLGLLGHPYGNALLAAARWHDWGKSLDRWQAAVIRYADGVRAKLEELRKDSTATKFHAVAAAWSQRMHPPAPQPALWAKFPDSRKVWKDGDWTKDEKKAVRKCLGTPFRPNHRHEAASALAAWDAWLRREHGLTALTVFLIASHHGKVRTVLRSRSDDDDTFGLVPGDVLRPVPGRFDNGASLHFEAKRLGAHGEWNADGSQFHWLAPSWAQMVAELLGPVEPNENATKEAIPADEPQHLGPFVLAFLEALLCTADARASRMPGKGAKR